MDLSTTGAEKKSNTEKAEGGRNYKAVNEQGLTDEQYENSEEGMEERSVNLNIEVDIIN